MSCPCLQVSEGRVTSGWIQALLGGVKQKDKRQRAETDAQEIPPKYEKNSFTVQMPNNRTQ